MTTAGLHNTPHSTHSYLDELISNCRATNSASLFSSTFCLIATVPSGTILSKIDKLLR